jgi:hypothetical protein
VPVARDAEDDNDDEYNEEEEEDDGDDDDADKADKVRGRRHLSTRARIHTKAMPPHGRHCPCSQPLMPVRQMDVDAPTTAEAKSERARQDEAAGLLACRVVRNDGHRDSLIVLSGAKTIFQKQLPKMPKEYITRLVFDRYARTPTARPRGKEEQGERNRRLGRKGEREREIGRRETFLWHVTHRMTWRCVCTCAWDAAGST